MTPLDKVLLNLATRLISASQAQMGLEIDNALKVTGEFCGFDSIMVAELAASDKLEVIHSYLAPSHSKPPRRETEEEVRWLKDVIQRDKATLVTESGGRKTGGEYFLEAGSGKKGLVLPFRNTGPSTYALLFISRQGSDHWTHKPLTSFHAFGEIVARALERKRATEGSTAGTEEMKKASNQIGELLQFERLLSEISATYINLPSTEIDKVIQKDLGRLGELLGADRCNLHLLAEDNRSFTFDVPFAWWREEDSELIAGLIEWMRNDPGFLDYFEYHFERWRKGEAYQCYSIDELPPEAETLKMLYLRFGVKSTLSIPISVGGTTHGILAIATVRKHQVWPEELLPRIRLFGEVFINAIVRKRSEEKLQVAFSEIKQLKERIEADYVYLRDEAKLEHDFSDIVGKSEALRKILVKVRQVAPTNATVLILGETGTGKGLIARAVHNSSTRKDRPLIQINCAALTPSLIESELFGHEKGAFTGANSRRIGRFELARGTTLFLDEIGDLPMELQPKLLRVLQEGEFERVGGSATIKTDVRIIAATNRDLEKEVEAGRFRRDLWYRLSTFLIFVPPLRERLEDVPLFVSFFVEKYGKWIGKRFDVIPHKTIKMLQNYSWPGNIRELENLIERAVITSPEGRLTIDVPVSQAGEKTGEPQTLAEFEGAYIVKVLEGCHWKINGPKGAAEHLGLHPETLRGKMRKLNIRRPASPVR